MVVALDPAQPRFDVEQRRGHPAVPLRGVRPVPDVVCELPQEAVDILDAVGRAEGLLE